MSIGDINLGDAQCAIGPRQDVDASLAMLGFDTADAVTIASLMTKIEVDIAI